MRCEINHLDDFLVSNYPLILRVQIKSFIILAVLRRSVQRVCRAHLCVIAAAGNTAPFEEMSQRWRAVVNALSDLTDPRFKP